MSDEQQELETDLRANEDFDVQFTIRVPRDVARRLISVADARHVDCGPLASAIVAAAFGTDMSVPKRKGKPKVSFSDPKVRAEIRTLHAAGMTVSEIAANLDTKRAVVVRWCQALELDIAPVHKDRPARLSTEIRREQSDRFTRLAAQREALEAAS